jgi:hypothetical protein
LGAGDGYRADAELEALKTAAYQRLAALGLGLDGTAQTAAGAALPITSSRMGRLQDALSHAYQVPGLRQSTADDDVFRQFALAWIIGPADAGAPRTPLLQRAPPPDRHGAC